MYGILVLTDRQLSWWQCGPDGRSAQGWLCCKNCSHTNFTQIIGIKVQPVGVTISENAFREMFMFYRASQHSFTFQQETGQGRSFSPPLTPWHSPLPSGAASPPTGWWGSPATVKIASRTWVRSHMFSLASLSSITSINQRQSASISANQHQLAPISINQMQSTFNSQWAEWKLNIWLLWINNSAPWRKELLPEPNKEALISF